MLRHVCPSRMQTPGYNWTDLYLRGFIFKFVEKIQVPLNSDDNNVISHADRYTFLIISRLFLLRMRNVSDKSCRENLNTYIVFSKFFFLNRAIYELIWKCILDLGRPPMQTWLMHIACWIPKATNTHTQGV